jgi:hypothetical protein
MILTDSTAVARQYNTRNRSRGSTWMYDQTKKKKSISAHAGASCTTLMEGRLGHILACLADPGRFYGRGKAGPNTDFCKIRSPKNSLSGPAKRAPSPVKIVYTEQKLTWINACLFTQSLHGLLKIYTRFAHLSPCLLPQKKGRVICKLCINSV